MSLKLLVGEIPYLNLYPVFHMLRRVSSCDGYEFVRGVPSELNLMLREGRVDVSPSSSIEYLRDPEAYSFLEGHSISSFGPVGSIMLFSSVPLEDIGGVSVYATHQSETSTALLSVLLRRFYRQDCKIKATTLQINEALESGGAYMAIGDQALFAASQAIGVNADPGRVRYRHATVGDRVFYVYDLGELWFENTGLPFVFALWIARKDLGPEKAILLDMLKNDLDSARDGMLLNIDSIASGCSGLPLSNEKVAAYWRGIHFGLGPECIQGLELFGRLLKETGKL